ncbi:MAG: transcription antitermination factor NusB [Acidimicrobiales bacterium]
MATSTRRQARERALSLLYEADIKQLTPVEVLESQPVVPDAFTVAVVRGVQEKQNEIDSQLSLSAIDWKLERMPVVDRAILRIAAYELLARPDVPVAAVISEAVELAKEYSTEDSGRFVNGVLAAIAAQARPDG